MSDNYCFKNPYLIDNMRIAALKCYYNRLERIKHITGCPHKIYCKKKCIKNVDDNRNISQKRLPKQGISYPFLKIAIFYDKNFKYE